MTIMSGGKALSCRMRLTVQDKVTWLVPVNMVTDLLKRGCL
jgi:hypothetical protein